MKRFLNNVSDKDLFIERASMNGTLIYDFIQSLPKRVNFYISVEALPEYTFKKLLLFYFLLNCSASKFSIAVEVHENSYSSILDQCSKI